MASIGSASKEEIDEDNENVAAEKLESWFIFCQVHDKVINVSCGDASQRIKWLAHVAIGKLVCYGLTFNMIFCSAGRWDDNNYQGWKRLGIPTAVRAGNKDGEEIDMNANICDVLQSGDHIYVETSIPPSLTK